jgi:hypothetical protein
VGGLLTELGKKLAERWLSLLVLPGALYVATFAAAQILGHSHPFTIARLDDRFRDWEQASSSAVLMLAMMALLLSAAAGLAAQAAGSVVERSWLAERWTSRPRPFFILARALTNRRRRRWRAAQAEHRAHAKAKVDRLANGGPVTPEMDQAIVASRRRITRISPEEPDRPGWMGDRMHAVSLRVDRDYRLDLPTAWPHLWLIIPDEVRVTVSEAKEAFQRAATLAGWGLLYLVVAALWWPAAVVGIVVLLTAHHRAREAVEVYATLVEATTRLHAATLATALGIDHSGPMDRSTGWAVTCLLQGRPDLVAHVPDA